MHPKNRRALTAGAAFVPEDVFRCGSEDKPHILQHPLWAENMHYLQSVCWGEGHGRGDFILGKAHNRCSKSLKEAPFKVTMSK